MPPRPLALRSAVHPAPYVVPAEGAHWTVPGAVHARASPPVHPAQSSPYRAVPPWADPGVHPYPPGGAPPARTGVVAVVALALGGMAVALLAALVLVVSGTLAGTWLPGWSDEGVDLPLVALRPGESGHVGDDEVTVDAIRMPDDAPSTGGRPPAEGRYVEAVVTVTYVGDGVGVVEEDLLVSYAGSSDDWLDDEWGCAALTESPVSELGPVEPGDTATFVSCMDVPAEVVDDSAVIVEDLGADVFSAQMWGER